MEKGKRIKKIIMNLIFFILLIIITFTLVFKDQDVSKIWKVAMQSKWIYIFIALVFIGIYISAEAINIGRALRHLGEKTNFARNIKYTLIGFFFSAITPAASGGQPMEIYFMHKDGIKVSHATVVLLMHLWSFQLITITTGIISAAVNFDVLKSGLIYLFILGIVLNLSAFSLIAVAIFSKKLSAGLIRITVKLMRIFRIKNVEEKKEKMEKELSFYYESAVYIKSHKSLMLKTLFTTAVQMFAYYSIPFWVYKALGYNGHNLWQIFTLQATLYATVSGIPSPGSVGVSEGGFLGIFRNIYPEGVISSAMLLSRGISFYVPIIISSIVVIINILKDNRKSKEENSIKQDE